VGGNASAGTAGVPACALGSYATTGAPLLTVSTVDQADDFTLLCGNGTASDVAVLWTAPASGWYSLNTAGSSFDTVLGVLEPACSGAELACSNDVGARPDSEIVRYFARAESVLAVIDGNYGDRGTAVFNAEPVTCPGTDLTGQPLPANLTTVGGTSTHSGTCGGNGPEKGYLWTPPSDGLYRFSVTSTSIQPALYLERGAKCGGELLGCNTTAGGDYAATVTRWLPAGQPVTLIVDSQNGAGPFTLNAVKLSDPCPAGAAQTVGNLRATDVLLDNGAPDILSSTCTPAASVEYFGATHEHTYGLDLALGAAESCDLMVTSDRPLTLYLLKGNRCDGPEVAGSCRSSTCTSGTCSTSISLFGMPNGPYVVVVEGTYGMMGQSTYSIGAACTIP
jgi:hypothetical protein